MTTLFISDLHLDEARPHIVEMFMRFLADEAPGADALYILGDLFESWIGDDDDTALPARVAQALRALHDSGVPIHFMHGNRDFLLGTDYAEHAGLNLLADPTVIDLCGERVLLMHGDTLCTDDLEYQAWRRKTRNRLLQAVFLATPLGGRRWISAKVREKSKELVAGKPAEIMDVNDGAVREAFRRHGVTRMIHGHTHRPGKHELEVDGRRRERWVLPDWYDPGGYLEITQGKASLVSY
jgi:UDP-2,3-diacylglucosamine hydrolase